MNGEIQKKNSFDKISFIKILKGAGIAGGAAALIYLIEGLAQWDFGQFTAAVVALAAILINVIKAYRQGE